MVKLARFSASKDKRAYSYILTPRGISEKAAITAQFLARKQLEYAALQAEIEELSAELKRSEIASEKLSNNNSSKR